MKEEICFGFPLGINSNFTIQFGFKSPTGTWQTVTLPTSYTTKHGTCVCTNKDNNYTMGVRSLTTTSFQCYNNVPYYWISIGY